MEKVIQINIRQLADKKGMSLRELARLSDIEPATLNKLANNKRKRVHIAHLERIAETLNITDMNDLMTIYTK